MRVGGRDTEQLIVQERDLGAQRRDALRELEGQHALKGGAVVSFLNYDVRARSSTTTRSSAIARRRCWVIPFEASYGFGDPELEHEQHAVRILRAGRLGDHAAADAESRRALGLRVGHAQQRLRDAGQRPRGAAPFVDANRYFTDGDDRPPFYGAWQPRIGFSYDVLGNSKTIAFGGWGRHFDRVLYNNVLDERFRQQYAVRLFRFSFDGAPRDGNQTIRWDNAYLSRTALDGLIASGVAPNPEIFLIENETKPPVSDQFSIGVRQRVGDMSISASYSAIRSRNGFTFLFGNRRPDGTCCQGVPGFGNILVSERCEEGVVRRAVFPGGEAVQRERSDGASA